MDLYTPILKDAMQDVKCYQNLYGDNHDVVY